MKKKLDKFCRAAIHFKNFNFSPTVPYMRSVKGGEKVNFDAQKRRDKFFLNFDFHIFRVSDAGLF
jgi:hypothetical protein